MLPYSIREDEKKKKKRENEEKFFLESVWLEGREGKMIVRPQCFLPRPTKKFSLQNGEKTGWVEFDR